MKNVLLVVSTFFLLGCSFQDYGKGVQRDFKEAFISKKSYFKHIGFSGILYDKRHFTETSIASHRIYIRIKSVSDDVSFKYLQLPPYYSFNSLAIDSLELTVTKEIYEEATIESIVQKMEKSDSLRLNGSSFLLLSSDTLKWTNNY